MKLIRSQKKDAGKNQALEQYPKVKTFSKAYDYAPRKNETPAVPSGNSPFFAPDERPYPTAAPASLPEIPSKTSDFNDPERIDLQDTLLTDESFVERPLKYSAEISGSFTADAPAERSEPEAVPAADDEDEEFREAAEPEEDSPSDQDDFWKRKNRTGQACLKKEKAPGLPVCSSRRNRMRKTPAVLSMSPNLKTVRNPSLRPIRMPDTKPVLSSNPMRIRTSGLLCSPSPDRFRTAVLKCPKNPVRTRLIRSPGLNQMRIPKPENLPVSNSKRKSIPW